jgi:hypothetical protein
MHTIRDGECIQSEMENAYNQRWRMHTTRDGEVTEAKFLQLRKFQKGCEWGVI